MKTAFYVTVGAAAAVAQAHAIAKRAVTDADILNYALTLEHLEATFYAEGLQNYTKADFVNAGYADSFYDNLMTVAADEKAHVKFLTSALEAAGAPATAECTYAFPATDVDSFVALANVLEGVGVSAYLGAAASIANKEYLTDAGSILTVEARHSSYLRAAAGEVPFPQPFDNPLDFDEVYTVASPFIVSCPNSNPALPVKAFPSLTSTSLGTLLPGSKVSLATGEGFMAKGTVYAAFITVTGPIWAIVTPSDAGYSVTIPRGVAGQSYVVLTSSNDKVSDDNIIAGPAILEIGEKNGRLSTDCTGGNNNTSSSTKSAHAGGSGQPTGKPSRTSQAKVSSVPGAGPSSSASTVPSAGAFFTGAASSVKPTAGFLTVVMGVLYLL
ncbi:ferritin-like domain-containing protein [Penicillium angulare]|uniref:ferritin-like domain-containing protein n=1 Tax=Penicillium angulare TaxID=116970 RepID=UPI002540F65B|nr:ferritin-like domain-containing protein [Penicillium angulare]KAJ5261081.1 ferritin-like domain-containing protein [Penicillium angulare]